MRSRHGRFGFNTQPPEGGWTETAALKAQYAQVSTHSRPKAAGEIAQGADSV